GTGEMAQSHPPQTSKTNPQALPSTRRLSVSHASHDLAVIDLLVRRTFRFKDTDEAALGPCEREIDERVIARDLNLELGDDRAARGDRHGLDALQRRRQKPAKGVYPIEDFPDDMKGGCKVGPADTKEDSHRLADIAMQRMQF